MSSPYVRRLRLGRELRQLRKQAGYSSAETLAKKLGVSRQKIVRAESPDENQVRKTDIGLVKRLQPELGVEEGTERYRELMKVAYDASEDGWWKSRIYRGMGERQARWSDFEHGAETIRVYEPTNIHGLLQTEAYADAMAATVQAEGTSIDRDAVVAGRMRRQEQAKSARLAVIVEEIAIRRLIVPPAVMVDQLQHLLVLGEEGRIDVRILPIDTDMVGVRWPREPFALLTYEDPADPIVVAMEQVGDDPVLIEPHEVAPYERLFERCQHAAKTPKETADYITTAIDELKAKVT